MEATCKKEKCEKWDGGRCVLYVESWWTSASDAKPVLVGDCAPIRTFLMIQDLHNRLVGVEKSQEQLRNECAWVQVVAEVLGKNSGVNLEAFVSKRIKLQNIERIKTIRSHTEVESEV